MSEKTTGQTDVVLGLRPLGFPWETRDPFLFCVHHDDAYPAGNEHLGPAASLAGRSFGQDFEGRDGWLVRGEIREQDTGVQQPVGVEDPFDGTLDGDLHGSKAPGHELAFLCADAVFARDGASHAQSRINDFVVGLLQSTSTVGIGPVEECGRVQVAVTSVPGHGNEG